MPSVEKEKRIQLITLKEISEQTHMRKMVKRIIPQMWLQNLLDCWMPRIKRCPFCHSTAHLVIDWNSKRINGYYGQYVICTLCSKRTKTEPTSDQAIEEWNHHVLKKNIQLTLF